MILSPNTVKFCTKGLRLQPEFWGGAANSVHNKVVAEVIGMGVLTERKGKQRCTLNGLEINEQISINSNPIASQIILF